MTIVEVVAPGPLATIQDLGRPGLAHLGVPGSGAADRAAMRLANRLVGNAESAAVIEATFGGLTLVPDGPVIIAVTGADAQVTVGPLPVGLGATTAVPAGAVVTVGPPRGGCRNYLAIRGGVEVPPVLGSRSTDTLSGLGPRPLRAGSLVPIGDRPSEWPATTLAPRASLASGRTGGSGHVVDLDTIAGPRRDHLTRPEILFRGRWEVTTEADRIGVRLRRPTPNDVDVLRHRDDLPELRSEGIAHGSVQVPPGGNPVIFLADHPVTGGYPVIAVLTASAQSRAAQLAAGDLVRFTVH